MELNQDQLKRHLEHQSSKGQFKEFITKLNNTIKVRSFEIQGILDTAKCYGTVIQGTLYLIKIDSIFCGYKGKVINQQDGTCFSLDIHPSISTCIKELSDFIAKMVYLGDIEELFYKIRKDREQQEKIEEKEKEWPERYSSEDILMMGTGSDFKEKSSFTMDNWPVIPPVNPFRNCFIGIDWGVGLDRFGLFTKTVKENNQKQEPGPKDQNLTNKDQENERPKGNNLSSPGNFSHLIEEIQSSVNSLKQVIRSNINNCDTLLQETFVKEFLRKINECSNDFKTDIRELKDIEFMLSIIKYDSDKVFDGVFEYDHNSIWIKEPTKKCLDLKREGYIEVSKDVFWSLTPKGILYLIKKLNILIRKKK